MKYQNNIYNVKEYNRNAFFVPYNVPSLKSGRKIIYIPAKDGDVIYNGVQCISRLVNSKPVKDYFRVALPYYQMFRDRFLAIIKDKTYPIKIELLFHRQNHYAFDFINMTQIVQDCMRKAGWVPNDDMKHLLPYPPKNPPYYIVDRNNPGVKITIL